MGRRPGDVEGVVGDFNLAVTNRSREASDVNNPLNPRLLRVSSIRTGVIATNDEVGGLSAAFVMYTLPAPIATATAAPIAAHLERQSRWRDSGLMETESFVVMAASS